MTPSEHSKQRGREAELDVRFVVRKCGYSRKPWRIIDTHAETRSYVRGHTAEGVEVWVMEPLHLATGTVVVPGPLAFDRKRDAVAAAGGLISTLKEGGEVVDGKPGGRLPAHPPNPDVKES